MDRRPVTLAKKRMAVPLLAALAASTGCAAPDEIVEAPWHRAQLSFGGAVIGDFDTSIRLDSATLGRGAEIDFENDLGFDSSSSVFRLDAYYRFDRRNRVDFSYFDIQRSSGRTISETIQFGDVVFPVNVAVSSEFDTAVFKLAYRYTFLPQENYEVGASIGLHTLLLKTSINANNIGVSEEFSQPAPLPVVGLHGAYRLADDWLLSADAEMFYISLPDVGGVELSGYLVDARLNLEYDLFDNVGLGVAYNPFIMSVDMEKDAAALDAEYGYQGVLVYLRTFF